MSTESIKGQLVRIAHANPEFRDDLLPLIQEADKQAYMVPTFDDPFVRTMPKLLKEVEHKLEDVTFRGFIRDQGDVVVENPVNGASVKVRSLKGRDGVAVRDRLFKAWRDPRSIRNWKILVSYISKNTGNKVQEVGRNLQKTLGDMLTQTGGGINSLAQSVWNSVAGAYRTTDRRLEKALNPALSSLGLRAASAHPELELRSGLIRLAYENPEIRSDVLEILEEG